MSAPLFSARPWMMILLGVFGVAVASYLGVTEGPQASLLALLICGAPVGVFLYYRLRPSEADPELLKTEARLLARAALRGGLPPSRAEVAEMERVRAEAKARAARK